MSDAARKLLSGALGAWWPAELPQQWDIHAIEEDGELLAAVMRNGTEVHLAVAPEHQRRKFSRRRAQQFVAPLLDEYGFLTTRVLHDRTQEKLFVQRLGFKPTWSDHQFKYYLLGRLPFARS